MDLQSLIQGLGSGLLTGGSASATTFLAVFKDIRKKIAALEKKLGDPDSEPPTGIYYTLESLGGGVRSLKNEIESWRDEPPDWLSRIVQRSVTRASTTNEPWRELEESVENRLKGFRNSLKRLEEDLDHREKSFQRERSFQGRASPESQAFVSREEYQADSIRRADEIHKIQENLRSANSFLKGVLAALGYIDIPGPVVASSSPPPMPPPRPVPRGGGPPGRPPKFPK